MPELFQPPNSASVASSPRITVSTDWKHLEGGKPQLAKLYVVVTNDDDAHLSTALLIFTQLFDIFKQSNGLINLYWY